MAPQDARLFLLDAYALIFRGYFAFIKNPRVNSKGIDTSAVFGFMLALTELLEKEKPTHLAVVFDVSGPTQRHIDFPAYKANRDETPEAIKIAVPYIHRILEAMGIPTLGLEGYEADDLIGTLARQAEAEGYTTYMMTPDKDFGQLVTDKTLIYKPGRGGEPAQVLGPKEVCAKHGIERVEQLIDLLGMMGDAVDNIPGFPGVGEKTAQKLLAQYGSMEETLAHAAEIKGKLGETLRNFADQGILSKKLATIIVDAPIALNEAELEMSVPNLEALQSVFEELEFRTLLKRMLGEPRTAAAPAAPTASNGSGSQMGLFGTEETGPTMGSLRSLETYDHHYTLISSLEELQWLVGSLLKQTSVCFDTETDSLVEIDARLVGIAFSWQAGKAYYAAFPEEAEVQQAWIEVLRPFFEHPSIEKVGQNLKYDLSVLRNYGVEVSAPWFDTMLAHYLINPDQRHNFDALSENYLGHRTQSIETLIGPKGKNQRTMRTVEPERVCEYAGEDADLTFQLKQQFEPMLEQAELKPLFSEIEVPLVPVLVSMERAGVRIDSNALKALSGSMLNELVEIDRKVQEMAGGQFNLASPKQLGEVLFERLKLGGKPKKTKTGQYATSEDILQTLVHEHPIVPLILEFRQLQKLKGTYVDALPELVHPRTGRIHTSFNQAVAATGRLSSVNPNLQNIPIRYERGKEIRKAFIPDEGHRLLSADYSQIELRLIAELSKDEAMLEAFRSGLDIHRATAARVFSIPLEEVSKEQRSYAKTVNFGIIYGVSAFGLSQQTDLSRSEAAELIRSYFEGYPGIKAYMDAQVALARQQGFVTTLFGRRRYLPDIHSSNQTVRAHAERNAVNAPIQGSAADLIKKAMIEVHDRLHKGSYSSRMVLQVHDELVFDCPENEVEAVSALVKDAMQTALSLSIPLVVDTGVGMNWLEAH